MAEFEIIENKPGILETNLEAVKSELAENLEKYKNLTVTEDSLPVCKDLKRQLSRQSKDIDDFRKKVKKELNIPIKEFEGRCKDLQAMIAEVTGPIDEGIKEIEEKCKEQKIEASKKLIPEVASKYRFKDLDLVEVNPNWGNVSATPQEIKADIETQIRAIIDERHRVKRIKALIEEENKKLSTPMTLEEFKDFEGTEEELVNTIKARAKRIHEIETAARGEKPEPEGSFLVRVYADDSSEVIELLRENGYYAVLR